jgi:hypothetical protein
MLPNGGPGDMPTAPYEIPVAATGGGPGSPNRRRRHGRLAGMLILCGVAAAGSFTVVELSGSPAATPSAASATGAQVAGPTGQAALLSSVLTAASAPASGSAASPAQARAGWRGRLARLRRLGGIDGQFTFQTKDGPRTLAFERGTIQSVSGSDVVVRASDGTTWTWVLTGTSVVREDGSRVAAGKLATGQLVFAGGQVSGGHRDARVIVIRQPKSA